LLCLFRSLKVNQKNNFVERWPELSINYSHLNNPYLCTPKPFAVQLLVIFIIAIALSMDSSAVALAMGSDQKPKATSVYARMVLFFGLFQALFAAAGWLLGQSLQYLFADFAHWVAFFLIFASGIKMILASLKGGKAWQTFDISSTFVLFGLAIATSINALIAGMAFGLLGTGVLKIAFVIGYTSIGVTAAGIAIAKKYGYKSWYQYAELSGGIILTMVSIVLVLNT
jgi:manganese efflux pump family protein